MVYIIFASLSIGESLAAMPGPMLYLPIIGRGQQKFFDVGLLVPYMGMSVLAYTKYHVLRGTFAV